MIPPSAMAALGALMAVAGQAGNKPTEARPMLKLNPVPFTHVKIQDRFWAPRRETNRKVSLAHSLDMLEKTGTIRNFELAAAGKRQGFSGFVFMDSDLYKTLEAVSYSLATDPDPALDKRLDAIIAKVAAAQMPDGYLNTHYQINEPDKRWTNLRDNHELYCAGHLFEAAVAHFQATGKRTLLDVATRFADHIAARFGEGPGKRMGYPGHPEIELALVKLWRATGRQAYFDLARFFVENRGRKFFAQEHNTPLDKYDGSYWQDNVPIREHTAIVGHAVRAGYLLSGVVDVARETGDEGLLAMVRRVWRNTTERRMYVTGGIGPSAHNEGFTTDYDLPNLTAYQETCASVAMILWNHRLNLLYGDAKYADLVEQALYNGFLAGVSFDGKRFFYVNPLASNGSHHRSEWFGCACCPPNVCRTLAALGQYAYATSADGLWVNLYIEGSARATVAGQEVEIVQKTDYPWDGRVRLTVRPRSPGVFEVRLRVPAWAHNPTVTVNGEPLREPPMERGYLVLRRRWAPGDAVFLNLPMSLRRIAAHPLVEEDRGRLALGRGPLVYCLEDADHEGPVSQVAVPQEATFLVEELKDFPIPVMGLKSSGRVSSLPVWPGGLYQDVDPPRRVPVTAIPYFAWDQRTPGEMRVWLPVAPPPPIADALERRARVALSFVSGNCQPAGVNDGVEPKSSGEQPAALCHWWPHKGTTEWVEYSFPAPVKVEGSRVYWFDDTGRGECRLPQEWRILYKDADAWKPVPLAPGSRYGTEADRWHEVRFAPVHTTALRLEVKLREGWAAGVHEWKLLASEE